MNTPVRSMFIALFLLLSCLYISTGFAMDVTPAPGADTTQQGGAKVDGADAAGTEDKSQGVSADQPKKAGCCRLCASLKGHGGDVVDGISLIFAAGSNLTDSELCKAGTTGVLAYRAYNSKWSGKYNKEAAAALAGYGVGRLTPEAAQVLVNFGLLKQERANWADDHRKVIAGSVSTASALATFVYGWLHKK